MKKFTDFIRYQESFGQKFNVIQDMVKVCFERYPSEMKDFFQKISLKDPEIKNLLQQFESSKEEDDPIAKPIADDGGPAED